MIRRSCVGPLLVAVLAIGVSTACSTTADPVAVERAPAPPADPVDEPELDTPTTTEPPSAPDDDRSDPSQTDTTDQPEPGSGLGTLEWGECDDVQDAALDCATLAVPLDHDDPDGDQIDIALVRLPASGSRVGAVLVNPGGPGGSGFDLAVFAASYMAFEIGLDAFDIVGFDPRGVGRSNGLRCLDDAELDRELFARVGETDDESEWSESLGIGGDRFLDACVERYGDTLRHYSTLATARDMDLIRAAMGDEQLSYIGISYGTYLGAVYATLFPDRVRAFVLDSGFEPTGDTLEQRYLTQAIGFEEAFDAWAADCDADAACTFPLRPAAQGWDELRDRLDDAPLPHDDGRLADRSVLETATVSALYDPLGWPQLSAALRDADGGDPTGLFELADSYLGRNPDGTFETLQQSNRIISCASGIRAPLPDDPEALADLIRTSAPRWGRDADADGFRDSCAALMEPVDLPALGFEGDAPVLVIGGVNDPATPFRWSEELAETMGPSASLVTWNGEGHGMMLASTCLMDFAHDVIVRLTTPAPGEVCDPDPDVPRPAFWDDLPVPDGVSAEPLGPDAMVLLGLPPRLVYGEVRTAALSPAEVIDAYRDALTELGFQSVGRIEPVPGLILVTFVDQRFREVSLVVLTDEAYDDPEIAPAQRLVDDGDTLFALISFG